MLQCLQYTLSLFEDKLRPGGFQTYAQGSDLALPKTPIGPLGGVGINLELFCILSVAAFLTDKDLPNSLSYYKKVTHK